MAKFVFLLILACAAYVCAYPSKKDLFIVGELPPKSRHPRAAYHDSLRLETHGHREHAHLDDYPAHHNHPHEHYPDSHDHGHHHDDSHDHDHHHDNHHDHGHHHDNHHDHDVHYSQPHDHSNHPHNNPHDHDVLYSQSNVHGVHYSQPQGRDIHHPQQPGYDEIYVYIDVPETYSNNSQASVIEAALIDVEDDADLRRVISDIISSELQDQKTPKSRYPQVDVNNKSPSDPDPTLSPEFIRRK